MAEFRYSILTIEIVRHSGCDCESIAGDRSDHCDQLEERRLADLLRKTTAIWSSKIPQIYSGDGFTARVTVQHG